jgi:hypothetical protein
VLPSGIQEVVSLSDTPTDVSLPAGFTVASLVVSDVNENSILYKLTISIANASLLDGGEIICDDIIHRKVAVARCPLVANALHVQYFLNMSSSPRGLRATLNPSCSKPHSNLFVQVLFGVRKLQSKECIYIQSSTQSFKDSDTVFIELDLTLESTTYEYCAAAILNGRERTIVDDITPLNLNDDNCLSAGATAGITVVTCFIVTMSVVVVLGLCVWCKMRQDRGSAIDGPQEGTKQVQETIYDEPLDTGIQLRDNQAYISGHVNMNTRN